ncbi:MAG: NAD-dependent epimerase/dehydratase family protein, partial [bacterium]
METKKLNILVTGGLGTIGRPLVEELRKRDHNVWVCEPYHANQSNFIRCDVSYFRQVERLFESHKFDYVYHLAAEFGRKSGEEFYESIWKVNAIGTRNILAMQERFRFRLVYPSSSEVYGTINKGVMKEEDVPEGKGVRLGNDYAISKWVNEMQILNSMEKFGTETVR